MRTAQRTRLSTPRADAPVPPLQPYQRCTCGRCLECQDNEKWDRIFAKLTVSEDRWEAKGLFQSTLRGW
jgi:hypothetical protein